MPAGDMGQATAFGKAEDAEPAAQDHTRKARKAMSGPAMTERGVSRTGVSVFKSVAIRCCEITIPTAKSATAME
jgi:hypothetical protein